MSTLKLHKRFFIALSVFIYFSLLFSNVSAKTGRLVPLPIQESIVLFVVDGKQTICVTEHNVCVEEKGIFVSQYLSSPLITAACLAQGKLWLGTESGLLMMDKTTFEVKPVVVPGGATIRMFSDGQNRLWLGTDEYGLFSITEGKVTNEAHFQNIKNGWWIGDALLVRTTDSLYYRNGSQWNGIAKSSYLVETPDDSLQRAFCDHNGLLWTVTAVKTAVFSLSNNAEILKLELTMQNNGLLLSDYIYIPTLGFMWATTRGLFVHRHDNVANPIAHQNFEAVSNMLGTDITEDFCRATGFRGTEKFYLNPDGKSVWLINSNGALQVETKQLQSYFK